MPAAEQASHYVYPDAEREDILRMVPPDGHVVGSIGCGFAATEAVLVSQGRKVHGLDTSAEAIAIASRRLTTARVVNPGDPVPFEPGSLDGLILADVIEHIPLAWESLRQFGQCVKPGGWVLISVPNMRSFKVLSKLFLRGDWPEDDQGIFDRTHVQVMSKRRLIRWCEQAGLSIDAWFDQYALGGTKQKMLRLADRLSLGIFHEFCQHRLMVRARRNA